jgi:hypothetical protein
VDLKKKTARDNLSIHSRRLAKTLAPAGLAPQAAYRRMAIMAHWGWSLSTWDT